MTRLLVRLALVALVVLACTSILSGVEAKTRRHHTHGAHGGLPSAAQRDAMLRPHHQQPQQPKQQPQPHPRRSSPSEPLKHVQLDPSTGSLGSDPSSKDCALCTMILGLMEQYAWDSQQSLSDAAAAWCSDVTSELTFLDATCKLVLQPIMAKANADFLNHVSPDVTCRQTMQMCNGTTASCTLFPTWPPTAHSATSAPRLGVHAGMEGNVRAMHQHYASTVGKLLNVHAVSEAMLHTRLADLVQAGAVDSPTLVKLAKDMEQQGKEASWLPVPLIDLDSDKYAASFTLRGLQWRGKDCNDLSSSVYPGRNAFQGDFDASADTNCNGISGTDPATQQPWESLLCEQYPSRGVLAIGDSATAHFTISPSYLTPLDFNITTYSGLIERALSELDRPECSWSTAWANNTVCPYSSLNISSIYQKMNERNRCSHRDYVNAGVNGASVNSMAPDGNITPANYTGLMQAYPDRYKNDGPSTVFFSLIGNDVCGHSQDYTPVDVFLQKAQEEFAYLDTILAKGSHVIIMGLVDGRVLYDTLHEAIHPVGTPYPAFYDYLNCLEVSPCFGWMNSNETIRDQTTAHAQLLNAQYQTIIKNANYQNFDLHYFYPDYASIVKDWILAGKNPLELIEAVDGFHPSTTGNILLASVMWDFIAANVPEAMGVINPNNDRIVQLFADQGGYE